MVAKVEAAIDPDTIFVDVDRLLRRNGPLAGGGDPLALGGGQRAGCWEARGVPLRSVCDSWRVRGGRAMGGESRAGAGCFAPGAAACLSHGCTWGVSRPLPG